MARSASNGDSETKFEKVLRNPDVVLMSGQRKCEASLIITCPSSDNTSGLTAQNMQSSEGNFSEFLCLPRAEKFYPGSRDTHLQLFLICSQGDKLSAKCDQGLEPEKIISHSRYFLPYFYYPWV